LEAGEAACREDCFGGVPVGLVTCMPRLGVWADDLVGVVGGDRLLVAVGGDDGHVPEPFASVIGLPGCGRGAVNAVARVGSFFPKLRR
jgi:hypothetical protein